MTDLLSVRLEQALTEKVRALQFHYPDLSVEVLTDDQVVKIVSTILPILRDELAAAEIAGYREGYTDGNRGSTFATDPHGALARALAAERERTLDEAAYSIYKHLDYACDREEELVMGALNVCRDEILAMKSPQPQPEVRK